MSIRIALAQTGTDIAHCFPVMVQLRPHLVEADFVPRVQRMQADGYLLAFLEDAGTVCAVAGYRYYEKLVAGPHMYVDDLVSDGTHRSRGHGAKLLAWLRDQARARGCAHLELDSGVHRFDAHRFYFRERMHVSAYHFVVPLKT